MKTWKKICIGSAIGITIGGSIYCGNKLMSDKPVEASTIIETATDAVADTAVANSTDDIGSTVDDSVVAVETTEEPEPEIATGDKKEDSKSDDKKSGVDNNSGTEKVDSKKEPTSNVENSKPAVTEEPKPEKPATTEAPAQPITPEAPKPAKPATTEAPAQPTKPEPEAPKHQHNYNKWVVDQAAYDETVVVKEAWTETVEHPEEGYNTRGYRCSYCGQVFASGDECNAHLAAQADDQHFVAGWGSANYWVKTKDAWTETINHPAETKTVHHDEVGHWECSCGARK